MKLVLKKRVLVIERDNLSDFSLIESAAFVVLYLLDYLFLISMTAINREYSIFEIYKI